MRLRAQARYKPTMLADLVQLIQTEFNKSFRKFLTSSLPVRWPRLEMLTRTLTTRNFRPESVVVPGGFQDHM